MGDPYALAAQQSFGQFQYPSAAGDQSNQFVAGFPMSQANPIQTPGMPASMFGAQSMAFDTQNRANFNDATNIGISANPAMMGSNMGDFGAAFAPFGEMGIMPAGMGGNFLQDANMMSGNRGRGGRGGMSKLGGGQQRNTNLPSVVNPDGLREDTVFISGLPQNVDHEMMKKEFGIIGKIKMNPNTKMPMIWIFKEKGIPKGDALVTYEDPNCVSTCIEHFRGNDFKGNQVTVRQATNSERPVIIPPSSGRGGQNNMGGGGGRGMSDQSMSRRPIGMRGGMNMGGNRGGMMGAGGGGYNEGKRASDWNCPDCGNVNFSWRKHCNRCNRENRSEDDPMAGMMGGPKPVGPPQRGGGQQGFRGGMPGGRGAAMMMAGGRGGAPVGAFNARGGSNNPGNAAAAGMMMMGPQGGGGAPGGGPMIGRGGGPLRGAPGGRPRPAPY